MKTKLLTLVISIVLFSMITGCAKQEDKELKTEPQSIEDSIEAISPNAPEGSEDWSDEEWDQWLEEGYEEEEWDSSVFSEKDNVPESNDPEEWDDSSWIDEPISVPYTTSSVLSFVTPINVTNGDDTGARAIFNAFHPGVEILTVRPQKNGTVFAIFGLQEHTKYKMVVDATTNEVLVNKTISQNIIPAVAIPENQSIDETIATTIFHEQYPDAVILKVALENNGAYFYLYGQDDTSHYQMKIKASNGEILFSRAIYHQENITPSNDVETPKESSVPETKQDNTSSFPIDEAKAREIFASYYPNAEILKVKLEDGGTSYYLFGQDGNQRYKMKILVADGTVVMNRSNGVSNQTQTSDTTDASTNNSEPIDEAQAKAIFSNSFPGIPIQTIELQDGGQKYYIYGQLNGNHCKMKIRVSDGTILYHHSSAGTTPAQNNNNTETSSEVSTAPPVETGSIDATGAQAIFATTYPGIAIDKIELQDGGTTYYMLGFSDNTKYMMKVRVSDGSIIMNKSIPMGGRGNYGGGHQ